MPFDKTTLNEDLTQDSNRDDTTAEPNLAPVYAALVLFVSAMVASVAFFGLPGLYVPAVFFVPVMMIILIRITLG